MATIKRASNVVDPMFGVHSGMLLTYGREDRAVFSCLASRFKFLWNTNHLCRESVTNLDYLTPNGQLPNALLFSGLKEEFLLQLCNTASGYPIEHLG